MLPLWRLYGKLMNQYNFPDAKGHFGPYGGVFVAETLFGALDELKAAYAAADDSSADSDSAGHAR